MNSIVVDDKKNNISENHRTFEERQKELELEEKIDEEIREKEKKSPFRNWYQMNREHSKVMIELATKYPKAQAILLFLLEQMDKYNAIMCSYQVLQEVLNISQVTVARNIKVLKDWGFIVVLKSGSSNVYIINDDLAWSSWGKNRKHCKFPANIILSSEENKDYFVKKENLKQIKVRN